MTHSLHAPRVAPLEPPYSAEVQAALDKWMPPGTGAPPLALFRTLARHERLSDRMRGLGAAFLGRGIVAPRVRELLILRTCARCSAEYEWGVHVTAFHAAVGLTEEAAHATYTRTPRSVAEAEPGDEDALVLRFADELHDSATVSPEVWATVAARFGDTELLEMIAIVGFYHLISFTTNAAAIALEPWAARFPPLR
jgi:hypothetical protein